MNKEHSFICYLCLSILSTTRYQHFSKSVSRESTDRRRRTSSNWVICQAMDLPMRSLLCFKRLLPHATAVAVAMEDGTTAALYSPLHHHSNHCLRPCHTTVCWRGPRPLPLTSRLTGRWSPWTPTPLHGVIGGDRVPSTIGVAPTGLHWPKGSHHRAIRERRREEKKKKTSASSRWSPAP
jgi:hypothetical protein